MNQVSYQHGYVSEAISTRKGSCFQIRYRVRNGDGTSTHKSERLYGLSAKKAARAVLEQRLRQANDDVSSPQNLTVQRLVDNYWLPYLERQGLRPSTRRSYDSMLKNVLPSICGRPLNQVTALHVEAVVQKRSRQASPKTVLNEVRLLHNIFELAVEYGLVERNPVLRKHQPRVVRREKPIWPPAQITQVLGATPERYRPLLTTAACTALRLSELLALTWEDIDFKQQTIRVRKSLDGKQVLPPKTGASKRILPVGPQLMQIFAEHRERTRPTSSSSWVFAGSNGQSLNADVLRRDVLYPVLDRLQLPRPPRGAGFHCFRHSLASLINAQTGDLKLVQDVLGHSTFDITANVYTHIASAEVRAAALAAEQAILGNGSSIVPKNEQRGDRGRQRSGGRHAQGSASAPEPHIRP